MLVRDAKQWLVDRAAGKRSNELCLSFPQLPDHATANIFRHAASVHGSVLSATMPVPGCGFVQFETLASHNTALARGIHIVAVDLEDPPFHAFGYQADTVDQGKEMRRHVQRPSAHRIGKRAGSQSSSRTYRRGARALSPGRRHRRARSRSRTWSPSRSPSLSPYRRRCHRRSRSPSRGRTYRREPYNDTGRSARRGRFSELCADIPERRGVANAREDTQHALHRATSCQLELSSCTGACAAAGAVPDSSREEPFRVEQDMLIKEEPPSLPTDEPWISHGDNPETKVRKHAGGRRLSRREASPWAHDRERDREGGELLVCCVWCVGGG